MSVAAVQQHLHVSGRADSVEIAPYLTKLCESLAESMIGESRPAGLTVTADSGWAVSADAVSLGLIVTELVINALKYAFPDQNKAAAVTVVYEVNGTDWKLSVSDNGVGASWAVDRREKAAWAPAWCKPSPTNWMRRWRSFNSPTRHERVRHPRHIRLPFGRLAFVTAEPNTADGVHFT